MKNYNSISQSLAIAVFVIATLIIIDTAVDINILNGVYSQPNSMKISTAIAFLFTSAHLWKIAKNGVEATGKKQRLIQLHFHLQSLSSWY